MLKLTYVGKLHSQKSRRPVMSKATAPIYQIKITLKRAKPPIWRRVLVSSEITLAKLHLVIQRAMGWYNCHLHMFVIGREQYSTPSPYDADHLAELGAKSTQGVKLSKLNLSEGDKFLYEYDFGDSWDHTILLEKILPFGSQQETPICIKGKRACPPEDVGGMWGYEDFLEAINDPTHPEHADYIEWVGGDFDPEAFDLEMVNMNLKRAL
jgi:Plasmid pRiA4b ORF-3-like protein